MITEKEVDYLPNWHEQVAELVRKMWTGEDGYCYFPHPSLVDPAWWKNTATKDWASGKMLSRFWVNERGVIAATASLVDKNDHWEIGRFNSYSGNPRGLMGEMASDLYRVATQAGYRVVCETTQCHTSSQYIVSEVLRMRFAGYGFLDEVHGVPWDILYFDNHPAPDFVSDQEGLMNNLFGVSGVSTSLDRDRLAVARTILSTEKTSGFPPQRFSGAGWLT